MGWVYMKAYLAAGGIQISCSKKVSFPFVYISDTVIPTGNVGRLRKFENKKETLKFF